MSHLPLDIILAPDASDDVQDILQYTLTTWGEGQMEKYAAVLNAAFNQLAQSPALGRRKDDLYPGCRCYQVERHCIYYDVQGRALRVARVLHVRMEAIRHVGAASQDMDA